MFTQYKLILPYTTIHHTYAATLCPPILIRSSCVSPPSFAFILASRSDLQYGITDTKNSDSGEQRDGISHR